MSKNAILKYNNALNDMSRQAKALSLKELSLKEYSHIKRLERLTHYEDAKKEYENWKDDPSLYNYITGEIKDNADDRLENNTKSRKKHLRRYIEKHIENIIEIQKEIELMEPKHTQNKESQMLSQKQKLICF